jgi:hypothetical protein
MFVRIDRTRVRIPGVIVLFLVLVAPLGAHHSISAEFDVNQPIQFEGVVKEVEWMNPHIYTHVEATSDDGSVIVYRVEGSAPNTLFRRGWRADSLPAGQKVSVEGLRAKSPESRNVGQARIVTDDGVTAFSGTAPR